MERYPVAVTAVVFNDESEFLLLRNREHGIWVLPGGAMEKDEDVRGCLSREFEEELGDEVRIQILGIAVACSFTLQQIRWLGLTFVGTYLDGEVRLSGEHDTYRWVRLTDVESGEFPNPYDMDIFQRADRIYPLLDQL